jgi:hypothetical protein
MALVLAGRARRDTGWSRDSADSGTLVQQLTQLYLAEVNDPNVRTAIEAASVIRRTTQSLLAAMLPEIYSRELYEHLADLSLVEATSEGLMIHEQVQDAISSWLRSSDPHRFRMYRHAAWKQLRAESHHADRHERWRQTADMLYLLQNPNVREAFFPTGSQSLSVEPARAGDGDAILAIAHDHEGRSAAAAITQWWQSTPESFYVLRDGSGAVAGFFIQAELRATRERIPESDLLAINWQRHLREYPLAKDETAIYIRRWLSKTAGESPSPVQAACWLQVKRTNLELRPHIRRCYTSLKDLGTYEPVLKQLGFEVISKASVSLDREPCHLIVLDFGPRSVDGWLSRLVANELGVGAGEIVDTSSRELVLEQARVGLTTLEFGVLNYLRQQEGKAVSRAELLEHVWEQRANSGSNVVDVVVRSLRGKLGDRASMISTVRGVGYRLRSLQSG